MKFLILTLLSLSSAPALAVSAPQPAPVAVELLASCASSRYVVVIQKTARGISGIVRAAGQSVNDPDLLYVQLESTTDPRFAVTYFDRANLPTEFKFGLIQPAPRQPVQAILERAILSDGTVVSDENMTCTSPISK